MRLRRGSARPKVVVRRVVEDGPLSDGAPIADSCWAILGPLDVGEHEFAIGATDADVSAESPQYVGSFRVAGAEEITILLYDGQPLVEGQITPVDFGTEQRDTTPAEHVFVVRNDGKQTLAMGAISVPAGFSVTGPVAIGILRGRRLECCFCGKQMTTWERATGQKHQLREITTPPSLSCYTCCFFATRVVFLHHRANFFPARGLGAVSARWPRLRVVFVQHRPGSPPGGAEKGAMHNTVWRREFRKNVVFRPLWHASC